MLRDKVRKLEQELAELTAAEIDEKEVTVGNVESFFHYGSLIAFNSVCA